MKEILDAVGKYTRETGRYPDTILLGHEELGELLVWFTENNASQLSIKDPEEFSRRLIYGEFDFEFMGMKVIEVRKKSYLRAVM